MLFLPMLEISHSGRYMSSRPPPRMAVTAAVGLPSLRKYVLTVKSVAGTSGFARRTSLDEGLGDHLPVNARGSLPYCGGRDRCAAH